MYELYIVRLDGRGLTQLTQSGMAGIYSTTTTWSPNGEWIAFDAHMGRVFPQIWVIRKDGSGLKTLTEFAENPQWSPDGQMIAFNVVLRSVEVSSAIGVVTIDSQTVEWLTTGKDGSDTFPTWSSDGQYIAFVRSYPVEEEKIDIWVMDADGRNQRKVADGTSPAWQLIPSRQPSLASATPATTVQPTAGPTQPQSQIAFISERDAKREIYKMKADGSEVTRLTYDEAYDGRPSWGP